MNKKECINLIEQYFQMESTIAVLKNPDFRLTSNIFYYKDLFNEVDEIKVAKVTSKNNEDDVEFDIYYVAEDFDGLFNGYFRIQPVSSHAKKIFYNTSKVGSKLEDYFYYVYQTSEVLKIYLISGNMQNALEQSTQFDREEELKKLKENFYLELANHTSEHLKKWLLQRSMLKKYITYFIEMNKKCSEEVKMFLINVLSSQYAAHVCAVNDSTPIKNIINVSPQRVYVNAHPDISPFELLDDGLENNQIIFLKFEINFEGGGSIAKLVN